MPIRKGEGRAQLWFKTKEEEDAYDDKIISNIQLKSDDFDDQNFSPVFNRQKKEYFLEPNERFKSDLKQYAQKLQSIGHDQFLDYYIGGKPNHTYWRSFTFVKFFSGFPLAYIFLRELPIRNFYARSFIMLLFFGKYYDFNRGIPFLTKPLAAIDKDPWMYRRPINQFHNFNIAQHIMYQPTFSGRIPESENWFLRQSAHMMYTDIHNISTIGKQYLRKYEQAPWDGTFGMPLARLADPMHKDSRMVHFY